MNFAECSAYQVRPTHAQPWVPPIPPIGERWVPGAPSLSGRPSRGLERDTITVGVGASLGWAAAWSALPVASTMTLSRIARFAIPHACALWLLVVSILLSFDPPQVLVYVDSQDDVGGVVDMVAREACPYLRAEGVPLPVPFEVRWLRKAGESQRYVPDPGRRVPGFLTVCPESTPVSTDP